MDSTPMDVALLSNLAGEPVAYSCRNPPYGEPLLQL